MNDPTLEFKVLETVHGDDGRLTQKRISEKTKRSVSSVNFALRILAAKGYIKISGANPKRLHYHITPKGMLQKSMLAYSFLKKQTNLYDEVRISLLNKLRTLKQTDTFRVAIFGWTPFTESAMLYLLSEGIQITALYVIEPHAVTECNRIPIRLIDDFVLDCDVLVLMEPLPTGEEEKITVDTLICFPEP